MEVRHLACLLVCLLKTGQAVQTVFEYDSQSLTSVPDSISSELVELSLVYNLITQISQADFNDKYPDLKTLSFSDNKISFVESGCFKGTQLLFINLENNLLTNFPDFHEVNNTLLAVYVTSNAITKISEEEINYLTNLKYLHLAENPIVSLPDLPMNLPALQYLELTGISFHCCSGIAWIRRESEITIDTDTYPCNSQSKWTSSSLQDITEEMLLNEPCAVNGEYSTRGAESMLVFNIEYSSDILIYQLVEQYQLGLRRLDKGYMATC
ncbi:hypothetical protein CAPTEDRAFT_192847 [Capitella teleta]|uniref:LRRCT domain-containing protein n=1 Tax=Capitella teleta TaxID=283909 RepID=R7VF79_CAPTE|nr:hypothetical protein CAPTEDRAFT_192847 [Capitella teleta]|eukprot:ELU17269.1 hypothetical protein CAPTEDRAFT_192847 [Capitella teleta]